MKTNLRKSGQGQHPEEPDLRQDVRDESEAPIACPPSVDPDWDVKIQRAREAWKAGRRLRKDQPVAPISLLGP
jgi:hypothetical protein